MSKWPNEKLTLESANLQRLVLLKKCKYIGKTKIKKYDMQKKILIDTKSPTSLSLSPLNFNQKSKCPIFVF